MRGSELLDEIFAVDDYNDDVDGSLNQWWGVHTAVDGSVVVPMLMVKAGRSWVPLLSGIPTSARTVADLSALDLTPLRAQNQIHHLYLGRFVVADERLRLLVEEGEVVEREYRG